jgi:hypothetical protein
VDEEEMRKRSKVKLDKGIRSKSATFTDMETTVIKTHKKNHVQKLG